MRGPLSLRPSAPAIAASGQPALGERWNFASRHTVSQARCGEPPATKPDATISQSAASREAGRLTRSSKRAEAQPKARYFSDLWPIMLSAVLTAL